MRPVLGSDVKPGDLCLVGPVIVTAGGMLTLSLEYGQHEVCMYMGLTPRPGGRYEQHWFIMTDGRRCCLYKSRDGGSYFHIQLVQQLHHD